MSRTRIEVHEPRGEAAFSALKIKDSTISPTYTMVSTSLRESAPERKLPYIPASTPLHGSVLERKEEETEDLCVHSVVPIPAMVGTMRTTVRSALAARKMWKFQLGSSATLVPGSGGLINSTLACSSAVTLSEFVLLAGLFDEFFIERLHARFEPINRYQSEALSSYSTPSTGSLVLVQSHHNGPTYGNAASMLANPTHKIVNCADPFWYVWSNVEKKSSTVLTSPSTSSAFPTQSWCLTASSAASMYTGFIQVRNNTSFSGSSSIAIGDWYLLYDIVFRVRA
jgi:hypothetical protein